MSYNREGITGLPEGMAVLAYAGGCNTCRHAQVVYLEQVVAQSGTTTRAQPVTLHTGFPAVPSPSPQKDPALVTPSPPSGEAHFHIRHAPRLAVLLTL